MKIKKIISLVAITVFLQMNFLPVVVEASTTKEYNNKIVYTKDEEVFLDYIEENYERESRGKKNIKDTELYNVYLKSEDDKLYKEIQSLKELNSDEIREMVCYLEVKTQASGKEVYNIYSDGYMKFIFTSVRNNSGKNKYTMTI